MKLKTLFLLFGLLISASLSATTIEEALIEYKSQEFAKAYASFKELAAIGNLKAQFNIGVMYARGEHVNPDLEESWAWFSLVNENKDATEDTTRVLAILEEKLDEQRLARARQRLDELRQQYSAPAISRNLLPNSNVSGESDFIPAKTVLTNQAEYPRKMLNKGYSGVVDIEYLVEKDGTVRYPTVLASSDDSFSRAAIEALLKNRFIPARLHDKPTHEFGRRMRFMFQMAGAEADQRKVRKIVEPLKRDAIEGGGNAKYTYAYTISMMASLGSHMEGFEDLESENANLWFSKAAQDGFSPAKYELGKRLAYGQYCAVDVKKALFWLEQAAEQGLADANLMLGMEYISGARTSPNVEKGRELIRKAADSGLEHAMLRYAWLAATSSEVDKEELTLAEMYINKVNHKNYSDLLSYYETVAALKLALGESAKAEKAWEAGMKELKKREQESWRLPGIKKAIDNKQRYIEL